MAQKESKTVTKKTDNKKMARDLFHNMRGQYIIGQALYLAQKYLNEQPIEKREVSNILDMKLLGEELFAIGYTPTQMLFEDKAFAEYRKLKS